MGCHRPLRHKPSHLKTQNMRKTPTVRFRRGDEVTVVKLDLLVLAFRDIFRILAVSSTGLVASRHHLDGHLTLSNPCFESHPAALRAKRAHVGHHGLDMNVYGYARVQVCHDEALGGRDGWHIRTVDCQRGVVVKLWRMETCLI